MALDLDLIEQAAHRFALLGDPTRLRILRALMEDGELCVGAVAETTGTSRFNASAHLNRLALAGLVARRREASTVYYRTDDVNLPLVCDWMCASLRARTVLGPLTTSHVSHQASPNRGRAVFGARPAEPANSG